MRYFELDANAWLHDLPRMTPVSFNECPRPAKPIKLPDEYQQMKKYNKELAKMLKLLDRLTKIVSY